MMNRKMQDHFQWRADLLLGGHSTELAEQYSFPLTLHLEDGTTLIVEDRQQLIAMFEKWRIAWKSRGVSQAKVELVGIDEMPHGRYRIWTTVREYGATGFLLGQKSYVQRGRRTPRGIRTDTMEVIRQSAAETFPQTADRAAD